MPVHDDESSRVDDIEAYDPANVSQSAGFDSITSFAAALCEVPIARVSLVDEKGQRFSSKVGMDVCDAPRETSLFTYAMLHPDLIIVPDATVDSRFAKDPMVLGEPFVRFYAGAPLVTSDGMPLGSLCVVDRSARDGLTPLQSQGLRILADQVMFALRSLQADKTRQKQEQETKQALSETEQKFRILADTMPQMVWSTLPDGHHDYFNARWYEFTGVPEGSTDGEGWNGMFHPDDQEWAWARWRHSLATGEPYEIEYRLRNADGDYRWTLGRALPIREPDGRISRWFGTCTDIHEQKLLLEQREMVSQELSHRIKNIFSVIGGLIGLSAKAHPEIKDLAGDLRARIMALGRAHDFVRPHSARSQPVSEQTSLKGLLDTLLSAYQSKRKRIRISGVDSPIDDRSATPLALIFHELATNAAKYGALSVLEGHVDIAIEETQDDLRIVWKETGGPGINMPPVGKGFGSKLIELSIANQLGGRLIPSWNSNGLEVVAFIPKSSMSRLTLEKA